MIERFGRVEAWTKWVAKQRMPGKAMSRTSYYLQYASVDCNGKRITLESTILYDKSHRQLPFQYKFLMNSIHEPVLPGSVGDLIYQTFCFE